MLEDAIQKACDLRFSLLGLLGEDGPTLLRDFEEALLAARPGMISLEEFRHPDKRARALALAERELALVQGSLATVTSEQFPGILESLTEHVAKRDAALALPEHEYICWECGEGFQSPARRVLLLAGDVDHGKEGEVLRVRRFRSPVPIVVCPDCKGEMGIGEYLELPTPPTPEEIARIEAQCLAQRALPRVRE